VSGSSTEREKEAERQRRLAAVFGEALPEGTGDERPDGWGESGTVRGGAGDEEWLRQQVPPHHG